MSFLPRRSVISRTLDWLRQERKVGGDRPIALILCAGKKTETVSSPAPGDLHLPFAICDLPSLSPLALITRNRS